MEITTYNMSENGRLTVRTSNECSFYIYSDEIIKWINAQTDPVILDRIAHAALTKWREVQKNYVDYDDFRSRA